MKEGRKEGAENVTVNSDDSEAEQRDVRGNRPTCHSFGSPLHKKNRWRPPLE